MPKGLTLFDLMFISFLVCVMFIPSIPYFYYYKLGLKYRNNLNKLGTICSKSAISNSNIYLCPTSDKDKYIGLKITIRVNKNYNLNDHFDVLTH